MQANKKDQDKLRYDLIPPSALKALATILTIGSKKYGDHNWTKGMVWNRVFGALMRHLWDWYAGQDKDSESGKNHLWHALCNVVFLIEYEETHPELDDRK